MAAPASPSIPPPEPEDTPAISPIQHQESWPHHTSNPSPLRLQTAVNPALDVHRTPANDSDASALPSSPLVSPIMTHHRSDSNFSDRMSTVSAVTGTTNQQLPPSSSAPQRINPPPAYIAPFGAVQVISEHRASGELPVSSDEEEDAGNGDRDDLRFADGGLASVNGFLDHLLYNILASARSTDLPLLRPAVSEVLRPRLGRAAIASADEELRELLAGPDEEEEEANNKNSAQDGKKWDLELIWKRTRLRVMVYMRLGEMEDEDEERYIEEDELIHSVDGSDRRFTHPAGLVSWSSAIFLTSILEYVAEQTLQVAGQAAYARSRRQTRALRRAAASSAGQTGAPAIPPVIVEEHDVEKVALNPGLGRLWRTWRKTMRVSAGPTSSRQRSASQASNDFSSNTMTRNSYDHSLASNIPLPIGEHTRDVDEIEVPGLARDPDAVHDQPPPLAPRRRSSFNLPRDNRGAANDDFAASQDGFNQDGDVNLASFPVLNRKRSFSAPIPGTMQTQGQTQQQVPGAFPGDTSTVPPWPEQKANAEEMMAVRRQSQDARSKLNQASSAQDENTTEETSEHHRGMIAGAIAGATAAAAGTAALIAGNKDKANDHAAPSESELAPPSDVDGRKSPIGIKDLANTQKVANSTDANGEPAQIMLTRKVSVNHPPTPPTLVRTGSQSSYNMLEGSDGAKKTGSRPVSQQQNNSDREVSQTTEKTPQELVASSTLAASTLDYVVPPRTSSGGTSKRISVPGMALTGNLNNGQSDRTAARKAQNRQSWNAALGRRFSGDKNGSSNVSSFNGRPLSSIASLPSSRFSTLIQPPADESQNRLSMGDDAPEVIPHPVAIQRMAKIDGESAPVTPTLTSASIRGPEDFDNFVQNGETMHYSLTPTLADSNTVRDDIAAAQAQASSLPPVELPDDLARSTSYSNVLDNSQLPPSDSRNGQSMNSRYANSASPAVTEDTSRRPSRPTTRNSGSVRSGLMARDARVQTESTRDFADFIRSTGPQRAAQPKPILSGASRSATNLHSLRNAHINGSRADSLERSKSLSAGDGSADDENVPPVPAISTARKLQPREPTVTSSSAANAELIDFIRTGPAAPAGEHRIPRAVAPFRTTMDSDQMGDWGDRVNQSLDQTAVSKSAAGVPKTSRAERNVRGPPPVAPPPERNVNANGLPARVSSLAPANDEGGRKRYRNKDPYPIDLTDDEDDEDDDLLSALPNRRRQEVSLMEFLNNTEPPTDNAPRPIVSNPGAVTPLLKTIGSREVVNGAQPSQAVSGGAGSVPAQQMPQEATKDVSNAAPTPPAAATTDEPTAPVLQKPAGQTREASPKPPATAPASTGAARKKMEARMPGFAHERHKAAAEQSATTRELADFLKSTAPSNDEATAPAPIITQNRRPTSSKTVARGSTKRLTKKGSSADSIVSRNSTSDGFRNFFGLRKWKSQAVVETTRS